MALRINFNYSAAVTQTEVERNNRLMNKSLLRLSTGLRILNAADDSAGLFIADQLALVAAGLEQGNRNIATGISALQIAENAAGQIYDRLKSIYVKAENAANDINDPNARLALQREIVNLVDAIQKIGTDTEYNGIKLIDGSFQGKYIHYGPRAEQTVTVSIQDLRAQSIGAYMVETPGTVKYNAATTYVNLVTGTWAFDGPGNDTIQVAGISLATYIWNTFYGQTTGAVDAKAIADAINSNAQLQELGISAIASNESVASVIWQNITPTASSVTINIYVGPDKNNPVVTVKVAPNETLTLQDLISQINSQASAAGSSLRAYEQDGRLVLVTNGETIGVEIVNGAGNAGIDLAQFLDLGPNPTATTVAGGNTGSAVRIGRLAIAGVDSYSYDFTGISDVGGGVEAGLGIAPAGLADHQNLYSIDVTTNYGAERAMLIVSKAIQKVDTVRSQIGALMNNLQSIYDAQKVALDNTREAESVIRNTDFTQEMMTFTTMQIRMQSGIAMLAQANTLPQLVLQLLR